MMGGESNGLTALAQSGLAHDVEILHTSEWRLARPETEGNMPPQVNRYVSFRCGGKYARAVKRSLTLHAKDAGAIQAAENVSNILHIASPPEADEGPVISLAASNDVVLMSSILVSVHSVPLGDSVLINVAVENTRINLPVVVWRPFLQLAESRSIRGANAHGDHVGSLLESMFLVQPLTGSTQLRNDEEGVASEYRLSRRIQRLTDQERGHILKPREIFQFGFRIERSTQAFRASGNGNGNGAGLRDVVVETPISVPLASFPLGEVMLPDVFVATTAFTSSVRWTPPAVCGDLTMTLDGPSVVVAGSAFEIQVNVTNHLETDLHRALVQVLSEDEEPPLPPLPDPGYGQQRLNGNGPRSRLPPPDSSVHSALPPPPPSTPVPFPPSSTTPHQPLRSLTTLRTSFIVGRIPSHTSTHFRFQCVALHPGLSQLGRLTITDLIHPTRQWTTPASFQVFALHPTDQPQPQPITTTIQLPATTL
mmetsp:Transcript_8546/g.17313  ORF Transcript_8546/g.17313 Transcript_8546/m.17313 type:complete len:480 (-) Transcript_8546:549-1988(-)